MAVHRTSKRQSYVKAEDERQDLVEHFEQVQMRMDNFIKQGKSLALVLKKRINVDKDHVKGVHKMVQSIHDDGQTKHMKFQGSLDASWNGIKEQLTTEALHISQVTSTLEQQALHPLQSVISDLEKRFRVIVSDGRKLLKDYSSAKVASQKSMDKYYSMVSDWESVMLELFNEQGDSWNPAPGNKLYDREAQLSRKMKEGKQDYETGIEHLNQLQQEIFTRDLPGVLDSLRATAQNLVALVNNALKCFSDMQSKLLPANGSKGSQLSHEQFNAAQYSQSVIFRNIEYSSIPCPPPYSFQEYAYKDETLMIQARKVQYMCMSKLSPHELASRAHQFLADGDKKRQHSSIKALSSTQEEGSKLLISLCLEYLAQPIALKEEGLFRVSGDAAVMKSLHADFMSGRATNEYLRATLMDQRDPNTISGLLKLHLREHPFLCGNSVSLLNEVLQEGDREKILPTVLKELTSHELIILTNLISVLNKMVQPQWKQHNKMSAHTLGIACGLSLFPDLDPSKATLLTEFLIVMYNSLVESHTLL